MARFLDSCDMISLTQVNQKLRQSLIDNPLWKDLLERMDVTLSSPFEEVLKRGDGCARYQESKGIRKILTFDFAKNVINQGNSD